MLIANLKKFGLLSSNYMGFWKNNTNQGWGRNYPGNIYLFKVNNRNT